MRKQMVPSGISPVSDVMGHAPVRRGLLTEILHISCPVPLLQVLLPASSLLQLTGVREACCYFLLKQLHPSNCLGIRSFAGVLYQSHRLITSNPKLIEQY